MDQLSKPHLRYSRRLRNLGEYVDTWSCFDGLLEGDHLFLLRNGRALLMLDTDRGDHSKKWFDSHAEAWAAWRQRKLPWIS